MILTDINIKFNIIIVNSRIREYLKMEQKHQEAKQESREFVLERYKYILQEIRSLNENTHKYLTLFQALATLIIGGGVAVFVGWKNLNIQADVAKTAINGLLILLLILAFFIIFSIIAGIVSWYDYRVEEARLLNEVIAPNFRRKPNLRNFWRWNETYMILFILLAVGFIFIYVESQIIPLIN